MGAETVDGYYADDWVNNELRDSKVITHSTFGSFPSTKTLSRCPGEDLMISGSMGSIVGGIASRVGAYYHVGEMGMRD